MIPESDKSRYCEEDVEVKEGFVESMAKGRDGLDCDQKECEKGLLVRLRHLKKMRTEKKKTYNKSVNKKWNMEYQLGCLFHAHCSGQCPAKTAS